MPPTEEKPRKYRTQPKTRARSEQTQLRTPSEQAEIERCLPTNVDALFNALREILTVYRAQLLDMGHVLRKDQDQTWIDCAHLLIRLRKPEEEKDLRFLVQNTTFEREFFAEKKA